APTTAAPTTTTAPVDLSQFPACPTDALAAATSPVKITVWNAMTGDLLTEFDKLVADYNASQTKVHVDSVAQGAYEDVIDKYLQSDQGSLPDVAQMPEYMVQNIVDTKTAVPVAACIAADAFDTSQFIPGALRAYSTGGVQWSMPFNVSDPVLFYNRKAFTAAGLDPDKPPASLQDIRDDSAKIVASGAAKYGLSVDSGFDSGGGWYIEQWFAQLGKYYADNENGRTARATKVLYDDADGVNLLTQLQTMINDKLAVSVGDNASGFDNLLKLGDKTEPAAMTIATSAALGSVIAILKAGGQFPGIGPEDIGIAPLPGPDGAKGAIVGGASLWMSNSGDPAKIAASWDFEKFMVGAQQQSEWSSTTGYVAVRNDAATLDPLKTTLATDPRFAVALDQLNLLGDAPTSAGPVLGPLREVRTVTAQAVAKIFGGDDVQSSLTAAAQQADSLITAYNQNNG
ncbi:MAG: ABC transporter substrate-binding protein, partial [Ilumatobacteraceae bacterium]